MKWDSDKIYDHLQNIGAILSAIVLSIHLGWDLALLHWTLMAGLSVVYMIATRR